MKKILLTLSSMLILCGCSFNFGGGNNPSGGNENENPQVVVDEPTIEDNSETETVSTEEKDDTSEYQLVSNENGVIVFKNTTTNEEKTLNIKCKGGTKNCYSISGTTLTFSGIKDEDTEYVLDGEFEGNIVIDAGDYEFELGLKGLTLTSHTEVPLLISSGDKMTISAKEGYDNYIYDYREVVDEETGTKGAVHCDCDLDIKGNGKLYVYSENNNGIHTKDDLDIKNLTLQVEAEDNCLKGNDSLTIESGTYRLIGRKGDCLKTSNSDVSDKGNQRGTITILDGSLYLYSATDGIDASYDCVIGSEDGSTTPTIQIFTDKYSEYSEEVTAVDENTYYLKTTTTSYKYSIYYYNSSSDYKWVNASSSPVTTQSGGGYGSGPGGGGSRTYYYYTVDKASGYSNFIVYVYSSSQTLQSTTNYVVKSQSKAVNNAYDTMALTFYGNYSTITSVSVSFTNYSTQSGGFGGGGMQDGNNDKGDYSTKGIKADNSITINSGNITIKSYDDCIHTNTDNELENGATPTGALTINGGTLTLYSNDDGIHADGALTINNGTISILGSYEGVEGLNIYINGGSTSVIASDDGMNATATTGTGLYIKGGTNYVYAGGDGVDANSTSSYTGIIFDGGFTIIIQTSGGNSAIDTERGYKYLSGKVLAIGNSGGMTSETTNCSNFSSVGKSTTLRSCSYITVANVVSVKLPQTLSAHIAYLGSSSATISSSSASVDYDANGVYWYN